MHVKTKKTGEKKQSAAIAAVVALLLASCAAAFSGESAAVNELMDFLLKKDFKRVGDSLIYSLMGYARDTS